MPENAGSPTRQSQIEEAMNRLDRAIDGLVQVPAKFEEKLKIVIRQQDAEKTAQVDPNEMVVPLASRINVCALVISQVVDALNDQGSRVEL